jgi:hypothetical protein
MTEKLNDHWTGKPIPVVRIDRKCVKDAMTPHVEVIASHLDLEGFCYVKLIRTGPNQCFMQDVTTRVLKGESETFTLKEIAKAFWREPAMEKWAKPEGDRSKRR